MPITQHKTFYHCLLPSNNLAIHMHSIQLESRLSYAPALIYPAKRHVDRPSYMKQFVDSS